MKSNQTRWLWILLLLPLFILIIRANDSAASIAPADALSFAFTFLPQQWQIFVAKLCAAIGALHLVVQPITAGAHALARRTKTPADDEALARLESSLFWKTVAGLVHLVSGFTPYRGPATPAAANSIPNIPTAVQVALPQSPSGPASFTKTAALFIVGAVLFAGCARLQPGANAIVVRAEQTERGAKGTFDFVLHTDDARRGWFKTNAPAFHDFCAWLREPQNVAGRNYPRATALIKNLDNVKQAYKSGRASSNDVVTVLTTLESAAEQASFWKTNTIVH